MSKLVCIHLHAKPLSTQVGLCNGEQVRGRQAQWGGGCAAQCAAAGKRYSKGCGEDRAQRQQVCFCQGGFRAAVEEALQRWQDGAREVKAEGAGSASTAAPANRPTPFKFQFFKLLVGQLGTQGLDEQIARGLKDLRVEETVEALQFREPPDDVSKTWVIVLLFRATWSGYSAWTLLSSPTVRQVVAKRDGSYPEVGLRTGRFLPGPHQRSVLEDLGYSSEAVRGWFAWGKGSSGKSGGEAEKWTSEAWCCSPVVCCGGT